MQPVPHGRVRELVRVSRVTRVRVALVAIPFVLTACVDAMGPVPYAYRASRGAARSCPPPVRPGERDATVARECTAWASGPPARKASR